LHIVAATLGQELASRSVIEKLQALTSSLQAFVQQNNANTQQSLVNSREAFYEAVTDTPSDSFTPAWRQILVEMGGEELFGRKLKQWVQQLIADNMMTPGPAYDQIKKILANLQSFKDALDQLVEAFKFLKIGSETLAPGEAEIALLIPRAEVNDKLGDFADELNEMGFILNTFSEVITGHPDDLKIRTVSSSGLMVFLAAHPKFAAGIATVIDFVVKQYKRILEIRKLHGEIGRLQLPDEILEKMKTYANTKMEDAIEKFSVEFVNESYEGNDGGRKNELRTAVKVSLNMVANRIDRGFNFEVRIEPPKTADANTEIKQAVQQIQAASVSMHI
jgi:hypothetical protein